MFYRRILVCAALLMSLKAAVVRPYELGVLTEPSAAEPETIARAYLARADSKLAGVAASTEELSTVAIRSDRAGLTHLLFEQRHKGLRLFDGDVQVSLDSQGRVRSRSGAGEGLRFFESDTIDALVAVRAASDFLGPSFEAPLTVLAIEDRPGNRTTISVGHDRAIAERVWYPAGTVARSAWQVYLPLRDGRTHFVVIDAANGELLFQRNLTRTAEPIGRVFAAPAVPHPDAGASTLESFTGWPTGPGCPPSIYPTSVGDGCWVTASETLGNNADTCLDTDSNNLCDRRATAAGDVFDFAFTDAFNLANDPAPDADAALANAFYWTNVAHDWLYPLGFDEAAGNFQLDNFGRGAAGGDEVRVDIHESVSTLARITVAPDGIAARIDLGLNAGVRRDSAFDADIILHEYVHGLTTRLIGGRNNVTGLYIWQSGAMGEGWSDAYAASFTNDPVVGEYVSTNPATGIRTVSYAASPLTFGQFGTLRTFATSGGPLWQGSQVHRDGEIWASVLWDLRQAVGQSSFEQVVTSALSLTPVRPDMLQARDAIVTAALAAGVGGANACQVWQAFAARGFGFSAAANVIQTGQQADSATSVYEAFDVPPVCGGSSPVLTPLLTEDAESVGAWSATGQWHRTTRRAAGGSSSWWFGQESSGDYNTGVRTAGTLTSPAINLTSAADAIVEWDQFFEGQGFGSNALPVDDFSGFLSRDSGRLLVSSDGGTTWQTASTLSHNSNGTFAHTRVNLRRFVGNTVQLRFEFDTFDSLDNAHEGWFIDDIVVSADSSTDEITVTPSSLSFIAFSGTAAPSQSATLTTGGDPGLNWSASPDSTWLSVSAPTGIGPATLTVTADAASLPPGSYSASLVLTGGAATETVAADFTVTTPVVPVGEWSFNEIGSGPGVNLADSSGNGHVAVTQGVGSAAMTGVVGSARLFDGVGAHATSAASLDLTPLRFTVRTWLRLQSVPSSLGVIVSAFGGGNSKGWLLGVNSQAQLFFMAATPPSSTPWLVAPTALDLHRWYMLTATYDRTTDDAFLYIDGVLAASAGFPGLDPDDTMPFTIGKAGWADTYYLNAGVDETVIHARVLSAAEVAADFAAFAPPSEAAEVAVAADWDWETSGQDASGNGHNVAISGALAVPGVAGQGISFNGTSNFALGTATERLSPSSFTLRAWVKLLSVPSQWGVIASNYNGDFSGWYLGMLTDGRAFLAVGRKPSSLPSVLTSPLASNTWHRIAATYHGPRQEMKIYLNGVLQQAGFTGGFTPRTSGDFTVGRASWGPWHHLNAAIDEVTVTPGVDSPSEVAADFASFSAPNDAEILARWEFDDLAQGPGTPLLDSSGNSHNALTVGNRNTARGGVSSSAREFGGYPDYAVVASHADFGGPAFSLSTWVRVEESPQNFGVIFSTFSGGYSGWFAAVNNDRRVIFAVTGPGSQPWLVSTEALELGRWYHLGFTFEGISRTGLIYIDGVAAASATFPAFAAESVTQPTFGRASWTNSYHLKCSLDRTTLYSADLSATEMAAEHSLFGNRQDPAPIAAWSFDDAGSLLIDNAGGHNADTAGTTTQIAGQVASARRFDGIADSASIDPHVELSGDDFTFSAWIRLGALPSGWGVIYSTYGGDAQGWYLGVNTDGRLIFNISGLPSSTPWLLSNTAVTPGQWRHVAVSFDSVSGRGVIYLEGVADQIAVFPVFTPKTGISPQFGRAGWVDSYYLGFDIDEARLWDIELSAQQVAAAAIVE